MRMQGSARFEPYFKVQRFDEISQAWKDIQKAHPTEREAWASVAGRAGRYRVMRIAEDGRAPVAGPEE